MPALPIVLLAAATLCPSDDPEWTVPAGLHLSTFDTTLAARLDHTGAVDTGAVVVRVVDADTGRPVAAEGVMYGPEFMAYPELWGTWRVPVEGEGLTASVRALAGATTRSGDERLRVALRVVLENAREQDVATRIALQLSAGGSDPLARPLVSTPFEPGTAFAFEDGVVTRDGAVVAAWSGPSPEVVVHPAPTGPDAPAVTLTWSPTVPARSQHHVDLFLAGPPAGAARHEDLMRAALLQIEYPDLEERAKWQSDKLGPVGAMGTAFKDLDKALAGSLHILRALGDANTQVERLTDRPYGFPATDSAVPAEILACFFEFGLGAFAEDFLDQQLAAAPRLAGSLGPGRRVALAYGLARCVRLGADPARLRPTAEAIAALVTEPAAVPVYADPAIVRADLAFVLRQGDAERGEALAGALPELSWATTAAGTVEAEMQALRRALSARDSAAAWDMCLALLSGTNANGIGSMRAGGDLDGGFAIGFLSLVREMLVDDHGADLHLLNAFGLEAFYERNPIHPPTLFSRFGTADLKLYRFPNSRVAYIMTTRQRVEPELLFVHPPAGRTIRRVMQVNGGRARLMPDGSVATVVDPLFAIGVNVVLRLEDGAEHDDADDEPTPELDDALTVPDDGAGAEGGPRR